MQGGQTSTTSCLHKEFLQILSHHNTNTNRVLDFHKLNLFLLLLFQMDDIDAMFSHLLGEMDDLTNVSARLWRHTETNWVKVF